MNTTDATAIKQRIRYRANKAALRGQVPKSDHCQSCGKKGGRIEGHHEDYNNMLDVIWLCPTCHRRKHIEYNKINHVIPCPASYKRKKATAIKTKPYNTPPVLAAMFRMKNTNLSRWCLENDVKRSTVTNIFSGCTLCTHGKALEAKAKLDKEFPSWDE